MKCLLSVNDGEQINVTKKVFKVPLHSALRFFFFSKLLYSKYHTIFDESK